MRGANQQRQRVMRVWLIGAAAVATTVLVVFWRESSRRERVTLPLFMASMSYRAIEPRLSGEWGYKPYRLEPLQVRSISAAPPIRGGSPEAPRHHDAVTLLLNGATDQAVDRLKAIAGRSRDAETLNDVAAALLVQSSETDDVALTADALAAVDEALAVDPRFEAALFNRALILDRLGLARESRKAWDRYLAIDHSSRWADEAMTYLHDLGVTTQSGEWERQFASAGKTPTGLASLTAKYPEQARLWAEGEGLRDWAVAELAADGVTAARKLELVRQVAATIQRTSGERLLLDATRSIDAAVSPDQRLKLALGHKTYWDGRSAHQSGHPLEAEAKFRDAARIFAAYGTPMEFLARYYTGSALHAQLRLPESAELLDALANERLDRRGYRAVDATLGWERGACLMERGSLAAAMEVFSRSRDELRAIGETHVPAVFDAFLASAFDYVGDESEAWRARRRAFRGMSRSGYRYRLLVATEAAAASAMRHAKWARAAALLALTTSEAEQQKEAAIAAEAFTFRARVCAEQGDFDAMRRHEANARRWANRLPDVTARARFEANFALVEGLALAGRDPRAAIAEFSHALDFFEKADRRVEVPRIYLERAMLLDRVGDIVAARGDLDAGIEFIEKERRQIHDPNQRATLLASSDQLFEQAIDFSLRANDQQAAFNFAERQRARALADAFELGSAAATAEVPPLPLQTIRRALAPDAAIVEYASVAGKLIAFVVRRDEFVVVPIPFDAERREKIKQSVASAVKREDADYLQALAAADEALLQPIRYALAGTRHIAISVDRQLSGFPFASLYNDLTQRFLIQDAALTMVPSATLAVVTSRKSPTARPASILSVAGDVFDAERYPKADRLVHAVDETNEIASLYARRTVLSSRAATPNSVAAALRKCEVAHFATHGVVKRPVGNSALLLAPSSDAGGDLCVRDIASLDLHRTSLVVLASCRSASAVSRNDGPENIALAFLAAGVPTVIASLTDLDDEVSAPMMAALHRRLAEGIDPAAAVQDLARSEIRDHVANTRIPLIWAKIVVIGGSRELIAKKERP